MHSAAQHPIREARLKKGLSQAELSLRVGVSKSAVSAWENDREAPESRKLDRLARALKPHLNVGRLLAHLGKGN
ncbi:MAG: helix-turn-helix transcriptional regulator [Lysobacter sp.]